MPFVLPCFCIQQTSYCETTLLYFSCKCICICRNLKISMNRRTHTQAPAYTHTNTQWGKYQWTYTKNENNTHNEEAKKRTTILAYACIWRREWVVIESDKTKSRMYLCLVGYSWVYVRVEGRIVYLCVQKYLMEWQEYRKQKTHKNK